MSNCSPRRGHWPRGKHRNDPGPEWRALCKALRRAVRRSELSGGVSVRELARKIGMARTTVRNWLSGRYVPDRAGATRVARWLRNEERQQ